MAYDIYGNVLTRGNCEVHPWVGEEYPCSLCYRERQEYDRQRDEQAALERTISEYYAAQEWASYCEPWFDPNDPMNKREGR